MEDYKSVWVILFLGGCDSIPNMLIPNSSFQALRILKKIPEDSIGCLGMHKSVARPEALVMERVPVPPICTRTPDMKYVSNTTSVRFGTVSVHLLF
jgi:hypothetical protein